MNAQLNPQDVVPSIGIEQLVQRRNDALQRLSAGADLGAQHGT